MGMPQSKTMEEMKPIKTRFMEQYWTHDAGITGVGIGRNSAGSLCLNVYVRNTAAKAKLPQTFEDVDIVYSVSGDIVAL